MTLNEAIKHCEECGFTTIVIEDFGYDKHCPNCGAKMESEEGKEDTKSWI